MESYRYVEWRETGNALHVYINVFKSRGGHLSYYCDLCPDTFLNHLDND